MISVNDAVVWVHDEDKEVRVLRRGQEADARLGWSDPIGAAYADWAESSDDQRVRLMLETAVELATQGFDMTKVLKSFAEVAEFRELGNRSYPMCRALTMALIGKSLEPNTMSFEELLTAYK
jgi:hypothetical protein